MLKHLIWFCFGVCLQSVHSVMSQSFCDNMTIDAITYAMDSKMYFIVSDGHYWWIKGIDFPPKEEKKAKLPAPFKRPTAAVYLDTLSPCYGSAKVRKSETKNEKMVWITELIGGKTMFASFDTRKESNQWSEPMKASATRCLGRGKFHYDEKPIDAMWTTNISSLYVFFINQGLYAVTNCEFLCKNPTTDWGIEQELPPSPIKEFAINGPIDDIVWTEKSMYLFQQNVYYESQNPKATKEGKVIVSKPTGPHDIRTKFLKLTNDSDCSLVTTPTPVVENIGNSTELKTDTTGDKEEQPVKEQGGGESKVWIIIVIIVIVLIVVGIALCLVYALNSSDSGAKPKVGAKAAPAPTKAGGPVSPGGVNPTASKK